MYELIDSRMGGIIIDGIDIRTRNALEWLNVISDESKKWDFDNDYYYLKENQRALKKLGKIVTEARIEPGYVLASMFLNVSVIRDQVKTFVIDGKEIDDVKDFNYDPYDIDYDISPDKIKNILQNPEPAWKICAVSTRKADQAPVCPNCDGKGFIKCEECNGSGRRKYVDGNYAGGDDKIKSERCYNCDGAGKIRCNKCEGSGKRHFFSEQYQVIKRFKDIKKIMSYIFTSTTFDEYAADRRYLSYRSSRYSDKQYENIELKEEIEKWDDFDNEELKDGIVMLYKTQKELIVDKNQILPDKCKGLYKINKKAAVDYFKKDKEGKPACTIEKHLAIPLFRIHFSTKIDEDEYTFDIYERSNGEKACGFINLPELSFWKSLFI
jgi:hypothetical protein